MRQILTKCWKQNIAVYILFIDFQTAYDTVWRKETRSERHKLAPPPPPPPTKEKQQEKIKKN
jgi:hypothetical protein